ncbi:MAG: hypothetical protein WC454_01330 [Phycisphaerae bacterium]
MFAQREKINQNILIMQNEPNLGQSQISDNSNENNQLQRKIQLGHLVKTNPNKANSCPERSRRIYYFYAYMADKIALSLPNGPIENSYMADKFALPALECRYRGSKACGERSRTVEGPIKTATPLLT